MSDAPRLDVATAAELLDLGSRIGDPHRASEQLVGAVALHNMLVERGVAYLADEVGTGKTYIAMSVVALLRHFDPGMRVLVIAPRQNIQEQWYGELHQFTESHVRATDLRVRAPDGRPPRRVVRCANLAGLVREALLDPTRDFLMRLTSFSFQLGDTQRTWKARAQELQEEAPWLRARSLDTSSKDAFKDSYARIVSSLLPSFDLVIVDEAHNLKHGFDASARNRVLSLVLGRGSGKWLARRVLLMSATPLEDDHRQVFNQLDVVGKGHVAPELGDPSCTPVRQREVLQQLMIRRLTTLTVAGKPRTRNMYRREWRGGGVAVHDAPLDTPGDRQRLIVALVQKKVAEVLDSDRFNNAFQIGMLASFESFAETSGVHAAEAAPSDDDESFLDEDLDGEAEDEAAASDDGAPSSFDDTEQTEDADERLGLDVNCLAELARSHRETFDDEMPHPKMDALVRQLERSWVTGRKSLVFVRRVASVAELVRKLERRHDRWLLDRLRAGLKPGASAEIEEAMSRRDGDESVFARFFRGDGPKGMLSGAWLVRQLSDAGGAHATFFSENYVAWLLDVEPEDALEELASVLGMPRGDVARAIDARGARFLGTDPRRWDLFEAAQRAGLGLLAESGRTGLADAASIVLQRWDAHGEDSARSPRSLAPVLAHATFWTELRKPSRTQLRECILPDAGPLTRERFHERERRREMAASLVRLGQPLIDLYLVAMRDAESLAAATREAHQGDSGELAIAFADLLEAQRVARKPETMNAFVELAEACANHDLILDANAPDLRTMPLAQVRAALGTLLGDQQPVGGTSGKVNARLVKQFRMPGQPFVLVTTEILQEGANLHPFCADVHHYGIAWMPSALEQRNGRVDRVRSLGHRRLVQAKAEPDGADLLQVYYPYLRDTIEVVQVRRVLQRLDRFMTLMHGERLDLDVESSRCDLADELTRTTGIPPAITGLLETPFRVTPAMLAGERRALQLPAATDIDGRWGRLGEDLSLAMDVRWRPGVPGVPELVGRVPIDGRREQTVRLRLGSCFGRLVVRGTSDIGLLSVRQVKQLHQMTERAGVAVALEPRGDAWTARARGDVLLNLPSDDLERVGMLVERIAYHADEIERVILGSDPDEEAS